MGRRLALQLGEQCIEHAVKLALRKAIEQLLDDAPPAAMERMQLLSDFARTSDFGQLRASHPELCAGAGSRVVLWREEGGEVAWEIADE